MDRLGDKKWEYGLWAMIGLICMSTPWLACRTYDSGRHYDQRDFTRLTLTLGGMVAIPLVLILAFAIRKSIGNKWMYAYLLLAIAMAIAASCFAYPIGKTAWENEVVQNEQAALEIVELLEKHKTEHGKYPDSLAQIEKGIILLPRGDFQEELRYEKSNGHFELSIHYGWYHHTYYSKTGKWAWRD